MKKCLIRNNYSDFSFLELCGINILAGIKPLILDENNNIFESVKYSGQIDSSAISLIEKFNPNPTTGHIDIERPSATIIYDLGEVKKIDRIFIAGFHNGHNDYSLLEYELYSSKTTENLFDEENKIVTYSNAGLWQKQFLRNHCDQIFDIEDYDGRYFAIKILKANATDDIIRISTIALYNNKLTEELTFASKNFDYNFLKDNIPNVIGSYNANLSYLTDGVCFREECRIKLNAPTKYLFKLESPILISTIGFVGSDSALDNCKIYLSNNKDNVWEEENSYNFDILPHPTSRQGVTAATLMLENEINTSYIGLDFQTDDGFIDQIVATSRSRNLKVDHTKILNDDFIGFGANCLPMALMPESKEYGYNEVYWAFDRARIIKSKPSVIRMWFQPDWLITTRENYEKGIYDFESEKMQSVYKYLDAFLEAGSEIELNFGWKASKEVCSWFNLKNDVKPWNGAPADLDSFAKCCSATLKELIINRGYRHIKYLTFYNESNYGIFMGNDFCVPDGDAKGYYVKMYRRVMEELILDGMYDYIKPWGSEQSGPDGTQWEWTALTTEQLGDHVDKITHHRYDYTYDELMNFFARHNKEADGKKMILTEYGVRHPDMTWDCSHVAYSMAVHNAGYSGALIWTMCGVFITDPCCFINDSSIDLWSYLPIDINKVNSPFYETSMQMRYIPNHSNSVAIPCDYNDLRAAAWTYGDDISVLVESNENTDGRAISIDLGKRYNKPIYRHIFKKNIVFDGNAIIPLCDKVIDPCDIITDEIDGEYQAIMYTTIKPYKQIAFDSVTHTIEAGESVQLNAMLINVDEGDELVWSIDCANGKEGSVDNSGKYTADKKAKPGTMIAVKASLKNEPKIFADVIINVK